MNRAIISQRITSILAEIERLNNALYAMNTTDIQRYPDNYERTLTEIAWIPSGCTVPPILQIFPKSTPAAKAPRGLNPSAAITTVTNAPEVISSKSCINVISSFWVPISLLPLYFLLKHPSPLIKLNTTREGVFGHNGYLFFANTFC